MYIEIDKNSIPYRFDMEFTGEIYTFELNYNEKFDFFTMGISKDDEPIIVGEKIVYGKTLFSSVNDVRLPKVDLIPLDTTGKAVDRITWENFGETVVLWVGEKV